MNKLAMAVAVVLGLVAGLGIFGPLACTPAQLSQVQDASDKRRVICEFVEVWAPGEPRLKQLDELCKAGADLQEIAAAYAGCSVAEEPGQ